MYIHTSGTCQSGPEQERTYIQGVYTYSLLHTHTHTHTHADQVVEFAYGNHSVNEGSSFISLEIVRFGDTTSEALLTVVLQELTGTPQQQIAIGTFSRTIVCMAGILVSTSG